MPAVLTIARHVSRDVGYDPQADFTPPSLFATVPLLLLVAPDYPPRDLRQLADALREGPDKACATSGAGSAVHLETVLLMQVLGVACKATHCRDPLQGLADLRDGKVQISRSLTPVALPALSARPWRARDPAVAGRLQAQGVLPIGSTAAALAATIRADDVRWSKAARAAGLAVD